MNRPDAPPSQQLLSRFRDKRILVIGDVMLDRFLWGNVSRISPEAPVPVVHVERESHYPGGAANVARNLVPFAREVSIAGLAGTGPDGDQLADLLEADGIDTGGIVRSPSRQTIIKTRVVARSQQVVRIDREDTSPPSASDLARTIAFLERKVPEVDAVIIEDYGKGFVTQELVDAAADLTRGSGVIVTADPNPRNPLRWKAATAIKPNRSEAFSAAGIIERPIGPDPAADPALRDVAARLFEVWETAQLLITLGDHGMVLASRGGGLHHIPTKAKEVFDVSGAGDTAIAIFTLALAAGASAVAAADIANHASGIVVGKVGTATLTPEELARALAEDGD